ncbi:hypothetical protein MWU59_10425 [Flavobacteriaceae bacterium F08102]|nr:hypothetical protein [Flavobacteriaceae bacterium F08102]
MKKILYLIPILFCSVTIAQENPVSKWQEVTFDQRTLTFDNPMFLSSLDSTNLGHTTLNYFINKNNFRDAYMPEKTTGFTMQSERFIVVNDWKVYGNFIFSTYEDFNSNYTAMANPYTDNPYQIADSVQADWRKQHYSLEAQVVSPQLSSSLKSGIGIKYEVLNGAQQKDPRPLDKVMNLELTPSLIYTPNNRWEAGINGYYNRLRQDLSISLENRLSAQKIYKMLGLGEYLYNGPILLTGDLSRSYEGNTYGGGVSFGYHINSKHRLKSILSYKKHTVNATDGSSTPFKAGKHEYTDLEARIAYSIKGNAKKHHNISLYALNRSTSDNEYIQVLNTTTQLYDVLYSAEMHSKTINKLRLNYESLIRDNDQNVKWFYRFGTMFNYVEETYPTTLSKQSMTNLLTDWELTRWFNLKKGNVSISYTGKYLANFDAEFVYYNKTISTNFVANQIAFPNHDYNITPYLGSAINLKYTFDSFKNYQSNLYFKVAYKNVRTLDDSVYFSEGTNNNWLLFTIGLYN